MTKQITACLIYLSTLPLLSFGQQPGSVAERQLSPQLLFEMQWGEVEYFKTLVYRFEVAWEEADLQSMADLKQGLAKLMYEENAQPSPPGADAEKNAAQVLKKKQCLEAVEKTPFDLNDSAIGKKAELLNLLFHDYIKLLETDLAEQAATLRPADKH